MRPVSNGPRRGDRYAARQAHEQASATADRLARRVRELSERLDGLTSTTPPPGVEKSRRESARRGVHPRGMHKRPRVSGIGGLAPDRHDCSSSRRAAAIDSAVTIAARSSAVHALSVTSPRMATRRRLSGPLATAVHTAPTDHDGNAARSRSMSDGWHDVLTGFASWLGGFRGPVASGRSRRGRCLRHATLKLHLRP
jgi:hypothetical protein